MIIFENGDDLEARLFKYYINNIKFRGKDTLSFHNFWQPIHEKLDGVHTVYISPDGIFNKINLLSLYHASEEKYILSEINIRYLTNTNELLKIPGDSHSKKDYVVRLFGDPQFSLPDQEVIEPARTIIPLPGTKIEVDAINELMVSHGVNSVVSTDDRASEENVKNIEDTDIIHLATHGFFLADKNYDEEFYSLENNPLMRSGLLLSGSQRSFLGNRIEFQAVFDNEDGVLTAYEVMNMNLRGTDLVVLSACETGLGEVKNGEGVYGLQRAFIIAGANSVIISLWKVSDEATTDLMIQFYDNLLNGNDKFEALALAQKAMMVKYDFPYYWGAFVISGI